MNERTILMQLDHPFILTMHGGFKDAHSIYFVLEYLQGGELFTQLRQREKLDEKEAKFYGAQVLLAFSHIHAKNIAYRDLKPEVSTKSTYVNTVDRCSHVALLLHYCSQNLVLDTVGYLKIVDFGLA